jgi:hypothetical protein
MRAPTARLAVACSGLAVVGLVGAASAAPQPVVSGPKTLVVTDPAGDAKSTQASTDITSLKLTTTGKTTSKKVKGKTVTTYAPDTLVVTMNLVSAPSSLPVTNFQIDAKTGDCGSMSLYYDGQNLASGGYVSCGSPADPATGSTATYLKDGPVVSGRSIVWTMPLSSLPAEMKAGSSITALHGFVSISEPFSGIGPSNASSAADVDAVDSDAVYKIG